MFKNTEKNKMLSQELINEIKEYYDKEDFQYHVIPVVKNALLLSEKLNADEDIVEMASYLHDIARRLGKKNNIQEYVKKNRHHIEGEKLAREFLRRKEYSEEFIDKVAHCVLTHRGRAKPDPETIEAEIVACADAMSHFDTFLVLFYWFVKNRDNNEGKAIVDIEKKIERNWNIKLTLPEAKEIAKEKYDAIRLLIKSVKGYV